jgi:chemotaxis protein methyltransferase CheR
MSSPKPDPPNEFTNEYFELYRDLLHKKSGMVFDETKRAVLRNAIVERMAALHITDYQVYYALLLTSPATDSPPDFSPLPAHKPNPAHSEILKLIEGVAINETSFFRNKEHYRTLQEEALPKIIRRHNRDKHLRFWSAGCSTGQEP